MTLQPALFACKQRSSPYIDASSKFRIGSNFSEVSTLRRHAQLHSITPCTSMAESPSRLATFPQCLPYQDVHPGLPLSRGAGAAGVITLPPTTHTLESPKGIKSRPSQSGVTVTSSSRKATISLAASSSPFCTGGRCPGCVTQPTRNVVLPEEISCALASDSAVLASPSRPTTIISDGSSRPSTIERRQ